MSPTVVEITHLKKSFGSNNVLEDVSLSLVKGENLVILGKSGSGKSVLIKCLIGLLTADDGQINLFEKNIGELDETNLNVMRKRIGFLFQSAALYDSMTVRENLMFPLRELTDSSKQEKDNLVNEALTNVGLLEAIDKMPSELSGGMKKRIGLARALIMKPEILLYDEPTTGLDPITAKEISYLILAIQKKYEAAAIIITHDVECAKITANRIMIIKDGLVKAQGTYQELFQSQDDWVKSFFH